MKGLLYGCISSSKLKISRHPDQQEILDSASISPLSTAPIKTSVPTIYHVLFTRRRNKGSLCELDDSLRLATHRDRNLFCLGVLQHHAKYTIKLLGQGAKIPGTRLPR
jgi:hypothetical protein